MSSEIYFLQVESVKKQVLQIPLSQVIEVVDSKYFSVTLHPQAEIIGLLCFQGAMLSVLDLDTLISPNSVNPFDSGVLELNGKAQFKCAVMSSGLNHFAVTFDRVLKIACSKDPSLKVFDTARLTQESANAA